MYKETIQFIRNKFKTEDYIPLHIPLFKGNEKRYLNECIDSTYVSSVGPFVDKFEYLMNQITKTNKTTAVVNGTAALQVGLRLVGVKENDEVITQALTFVATANAIAYNNAHPPPTTPPSSTAALVAFKASVILSLISPTSTSLAPPTLMIPTPPFNLANLSYIFSLSYSDVDISN